METELELTFSLQVPRVAWSPGLPGAPLIWHFSASMALGAQCEGGSL